MEKQELMKLTKEQLVEMIVNGTKGRKTEVLRLIKEGDGNCSLDYISETININKKNVSSILSGLRKAGNHFMSFRVGSESLVQWVGCDNGKGDIINEAGDKVDRTGRLID